MASCFFFRFLFHFPDTFIVLIFLSFYFIGAHYPLVQILSDQVVWTFSASAPPLPRPAPAPVTSPLAYKARTAQPRQMDGVGRVGRTRPAN